MSDKEDKDEIFKRKAILAGALGVKDGAKFLDVFKLKDFPEGREKLKKIFGERRYNEMTQDKLIHEIIRFRDFIDSMGDDAKIGVPFLKNLLSGLEAPAAPDAEALEADYETVKEVLEGVFVTTTGAGIFLALERLKDAALQSQAPSVDDAERKAIVDKFDYLIDRINANPNSFSSHVTLELHEAETIRALLSGTAKKVEG